MFRLSVVIPALAVALAIPAARPQQLTEQEARQVAQKGADNFYRAFKAKDAAGIAAGYTDDTVRISGNGTLSLGRAAVEKFYAKGVQSFDEDPPKIIEAKIISNDTIVVFGSWSSIYHGDNGPAHVGGRWAATGWKTAALLVSNIPQK
jgi:ketosteroid isomerase-like protein